MKQQGAALITALFIMALVAIAAAAMSIRLQIVIKTTELSLNYDQLFLATLGVTDWAEGLLVSNAKVLQQNLSGKNQGQSQAIDKLPQSFAPLRYENIVISGKLSDEQAKFNINNLGLKTYVKQSQNQLLTLLNAVDPDLNVDQAKKIVSAITSWVTDKSDATVADIFSSVYAKQNPPYQTAHQPLASITELRLIAGITPKLYEKLVPFVTALPVFKTPTLININTAAAPVLMILGAGISKNVADNLVAYRTSNNGFKNSDQVQQFVKTQKNLIIPASDYTLISNFFLVTAAAELGDQSLELNSLLQRQISKNQNGQLQVVVNSLWQSQGTL